MSKQRGKQRNQIANPKGAAKTEHSSPKMVHPVASPRVAAGRQQDKSVHTTRA